MQKRSGRTKVRSFLMVFCYSGVFSFACRGPAFAPNGSSGTGYSSVSTSACHRLAFASLGIRLVAASSISLAPAFRRGSLIPLQLLSPPDPLRWAPAGAPEWRLAPLIQVTPASPLLPATDWLSRRWASASSLQAPYPSPRLSAGAHSFRCSSSPHRTRFAGLRRGPRNGDWLL